MCEKGPLGGALFWLVVSTLTFAIGFGTPGWILTSTEDIGLWQVCPSNRTVGPCHDANDRIDESWFRTTQILACVSLALIVLTFLYTFIITCRRQPPTSCISMSSVLSLVTAALVFGTCTEFAVNFHDDGDLGYSFGVCLLSGFMMLISVFLAGLQCCCPSRYNSERTPLLSREVV